MELKLHHGDALTVFHALKLGNNGHVSRVGVEALASCPQILHHAPPWWVVVSNGSTQWRCHQAERQAATRHQHSGRCCRSRTDPSPAPSTADRDG